MTLMEPRKHGSASDSAVGSRLSRLDGRLKITGGATYALEQPVENVAHAVLVPATIGAGRVVSIDTSAAEASPGVRLVITPQTEMGLLVSGDWGGNRPEIVPYHPLSLDVTYNGQAIAAVIAETIEQAAEAARLVKVEYEEGAVVVDLFDPKANNRKSLDQMAVKWGDAEAAFAGAAVQVEAEYRTPREYHVPIEPHGLIAEWSGDQLTVWEPSQWTHGMARMYSEWFDLPLENVRVISPFIGGGFGSKGAPYFYGAVAIFAAKVLQRPVKLAVTRSQGFTAYGGRASTQQTLKLGASEDGKLQAIIVDGANETSTYADFTEQTEAATPLMYAVENFRSSHTLVKTNTVTPGALRAPGKNPSAFGIESAMDELAYKLGMDPLELRLKNYADHDYQSGKPWSSRRLREALETGAERFGWSRRSHAPRSMKEGRTLIGWGIGCGTFPNLRNSAEALIRILPNGRVEVESGSIDMGQGTYTIVAQTAADALGVPVDLVDVKLGDSLWAGAPVAGGSMLASSITGAVHKAAVAAREELIALALTEEGSPFRETGANTLSIENGRITTSIGDGPALDFATFLRQVRRESLEVRRDTLPEGTKPADANKFWTTMANVQGPTATDFSVHSWGAHFVEVKVDEDFGTVRVSRIVSAFDCGLIYNPKLAESQWRGGIIMGIGQALLEEGLIDPRNGRVINNNLGDYLVPTNADVPHIEVISVGEPDLEASVLGGKGVGEVGIVGVAPAIANAVFHATGKRIRDLPLTLDKIL
ncbi:xanthine dehydrogenase family protein molybdopterin-binding subunit [Rhizobium oryzicola]|uniref:Xanthine dehydrogenase family protein molybdopterin-binding subunit n=1 Tax=Rhizobium oryzicola TaxID=1232668 RepID=A0ABT8SWT6_9HYPH|nr:xanthine dehydrogenase family protein molybdopterin-binding subunit [Rhizobium oryzicola]MDO1582894.1 xanthine dehydrogenase family protein molybdopterin-binding subunit [Rhizobium oryzicola]